ncbi:MAG: DUF1788 domain-containing protein [Victivallales bacterium]|nr:DUF1788 domain-containing protein [Victivallales bacterium]
MPTIPEIFQRVLSILQNQFFLDCSLAKPEVPFYIYPYNASKQAEMDDMVKNLVSNLASKGVPVLEINLFNLLLDCMKKNDDLEWELEHEQERSREEMLAELQGILDVETEIVPAIRKLREATPHKLLFLTGIGACYPVLRAHVLLNNLFSVVNDVPLVMFFPGEYCQVPGSGATLELFGRFRGDGYYRAFNLLETRV